MALYTKLSKLLIESLIIYHCMCVYLLYIETKNTTLKSETVKHRKVHLSSYTIATSIAIVAITVTVVFQKCAK